MEPDACSIEIQALENAERAPGRGLEPYRYVEVDAGGFSLWFYVGPKSDYVIIPLTFCSCYYFARKLRAGEPRPCSHLVGLARVLRRGGYRRIAMDPRTAARCGVEASIARLSPTLRSELIRSSQDREGQ